MANITHGLRTKEALEEKREVRELIRAAKALL
jgi:hypothetical protein